MTRRGQWWAMALVAGLCGSGSVEAQLLGSLSEEEEIEVGRRAAEEIEKDLVLVDDDEVTSYVSELGQRLVRESQRRGLSYTFKVADAAEINAFALPGGFIYVNRGLIEAADEEAELAGVLGHEIGHVVARHGAEQAQRAAYANLGLSVLGSILGRGTRAQIGSLAAEMATTGVFLRFGRDAEREADRLGARNVAAAGFDPAGMITFFEKLAAMRDGQANVVERFFASHPDPAERVANISDLVESLEASGDYQPTSRRFVAVKARLSRLPPPPSAGVDDDSVDSDAAPEDASNGGSGPGLDRASAEPVPVPYDGEELDREIAARFAPVFRQGLGSSPRFDYITAFDFDGDWQGDNNWENAAHERHALTATVYYNLSETESHYLIHYAVFHPRDYKGGNVRGVVLSEIIREGSRRHGDYDPTGLSESAVLAHENDLEGALVVVRKPTGFMGAARVEYVETLAHNQFLQYRVDRRWLGRDSDGVRVEDEHPVLFIEPRGHGVEAYRGGDQDENAQGLVTYRYTGRTEAPTGERNESVGYALVSMAETLWPFARARHGGIFGGAFDYRRWTIAVADGSNTVTRDVTLGNIGSAFLGQVGGRNMARPPWGWFDQDEPGQRQGAWFLTPAETVKRHFGLDEQFSTTYLHHPVMGVLRAAPPLSDQ